MMSSSEEDVADFEDYIASLNAMEERAAAEERRQENRRLWRETTWAGWSVATLQSLGDNAFTRAVTDSLSHDKSAGFIVLTNAARIALILAFVAVVYAIGRIFNMLIGREIVVEQEVVVVEEITRSEQEARQKKKEEEAAQSKVQRRGKRQNRSAAADSDNKED